MSHPFVLSTSVKTALLNARQSPLCTAVQDGKVTVLAETIKCDFNNQQGKWHYFFFVQTSKIVMLSIINVQGKDKYNTNIHLIYHNLEH